MHQNARCVSFSNKERNQTLALESARGNEDDGCLPPFMISCWANGSLSTGRWTIPQISAPGSSRRSRLPILQAREGLTLDKIRIRKVLIFGYLRLSKQSGFHRKLNRGGRWATFRPQLRER